MYPVDKFVCVKVFSSKIVNSSVSLSPCISFPSGSKNLLKVIVILFLRDK